MENQYELLASLASRMMLSPKEAVALPSVIDKGCEISGRTREDVINRCFGNPRLAEYIASVCREAATVL